MEPLGHMAGLGAAFVGSVSTFIALPGLGPLCAQQLGATVTVEERELRHQLVIRADVYT